MTEEKRGCIMILSHISSDRLKQLTWIQNIPRNRIDYVIIRGEPNLKTDYIYSPDTHICTLKCPDDYLNLCIKVKLAINFILSKFNSSFVLKIDDDVLVNMSRLMEYIDKPDHCDYEGVICYNYGLIYCGGPLYYLNRKSLDFVKDMKTHGFTYQEDACIGRSLSQNKCVLRAVNTYSNNINEMNTSISYHDNLRIIFSGISAGENIPDHKKRVSKELIHGDTVVIAPTPSQNQRSIISSLFRATPKNFIVRINR
jgi:hypothetical protein